MNQSKKEKKSHIKLNINGIQHSYCASSAFPSSVIIITDKANELVQQHDLPDNALFQIAHAPLLASISGWSWIYAIYCVLQVLIDQ